MNHSKSVNKLAFVTICLMLLFPVLRAKAQRINPDVLPGAPGAPGPVTGPSTAVAGTTGTYTVTAGANATSYSWTLTTGAGTISNTGLSATVTWNSSFTGSAVVSCSSVNSVASTAATPKTVTVSPAPTPLVAGTISPSTQTINYNTAAALTGTEATGGNYTYTYQWQSSTSSGGTYTNISGATTQNYTTPNLTATTYFLRVDHSNGSSANTNTATVTVYPRLVPGTLTPTSQTVLSGGATTAISSTAATGGNGTYTYQWQSSPDNTNWTNITGATTTTYSPGTANNTIYYRLAVTSNGQTQYSSSSAVLVTDCYTLNSTPTASMNYIISNTFREAGITSTITDRQIATMGVCDVNQTIQYMDGLGRPIQTIQVKASPSGSDIIQPTAYDAYGRENIKYLPYVAPSATTNGAYQSTALTTDQATFYNPAGSTGTEQSNGVVRTDAAFAQTDFEPSPLNRLIEQGAPGDSWQIVSPGDANSPNHTAKMVYTANDQTSTFVGTTTLNNPGSKIVALYTTTINSSTNTQRLVRAGSATYAPNQLYVTISKNENWNPNTNDGCIGTTEEYKDSQGQMVLRRTYNLTGGVVQMLSTYYVYDVLGNLAFVLPPGANPDNTGVPAQAVLDNLCYQYQYDQRNRMIAKKIPGRGWDYIIYNTFDQVIGTQDSVQRGKSPQQVSYIKYDSQGREIMSGYYTLSPGTHNVNYQSTIQAAANAQTSLWESISAGTYSNVTVPTSSATVLKYNYYDNYTAASLPTNYTAPTGASAMTRGLPTASKVAVLNTPADYLWSVNYYDELGRLTKTYDQHYLGGHASHSLNNYNATVNMYDFTNTIIQTTRQLYTSASTTTPAVTVANTYLYDQMGRKTQSWETINSLSPLLLSQMDYNSIGQVMTKHLSSTNNGSSFLQDISYLYNERSWMVLDSSSLFKERLQYNINTNPGLAATPQYNGNISTQTWRTGTATADTSAVYAYDNLNRLTSGGCTNGNTENNITYDLMGNITQLYRYRNNGAPTVPIDMLSYVYTTTTGVYTNQAQSITDGASGTFEDSGLLHGKWTYLYDGNGNLTSNTNAISNIQNKTTTYNLLNLPLTYTITSGTVTYTYDADGRKLRKTLTPTTGSVVTEDYINGIQYTTIGSTTAIDFIQTDEGRALYGLGAYDLEYSLTDHLGNSRLSFDLYSGAIRIDQQDDYYAFGMEISTGTIVSPKNEYLYNKKELQEETQLYDYGARFYDPVIARFTSIDPKAEKVRRFSPYVYVEDNPVKFIDPDGMETKNPTDPTVNTTVTSQEDKYGRLYVTQTTTTTTVTDTKTGSVTTVSTSSATDVISSNPDDKTTHGDVTTTSKTTTVDGDKTTFSDGKTTTQARGDSKDFSPLGKVDKALEGFRNEHGVQFNEFVGKEGGDAMKDMVNAGTLGLLKLPENLFGKALEYLHIIDKGIDKSIEAATEARGGNPKFMLVTHNGERVGGLIPPEKL